MPKFKIMAVYSTYCTATVEAENVEDAYKLAKELDGDAFKPSNEHFDWHINQVSEIE
jgi:hypothetical protein